MKKTVEEGRLLRIFVGENHRHHGIPLFEAIIQKAREKGLAGATILKAVEGYGIHKKIHTHRLLELAEEMPIIIEIVDTPSLPLDKDPSALQMLHRIGLIKTAKETSTNKEHLQKIIKDIAQTDGKTPPDIERVFTLYSSGP